MAAPYIASALQSRDISFDKPQHSEWRILSKETDECGQFSQEEAQRYRSPSVAEARFRCENKHDPTQKAHMRIYMQIPHHGTELDSAEDRGKQASTSHRPRELQVLERLTAREVKHAPSLLGQKEVSQGDNGWVPGGFVCYLLWNELGGIRLGEGDTYNNYFWNSLMPPQREEIRKAFRVAYEYVSVFLPFASLYTS